MRIGQGYDVHRLTEGRKLILGGVDIPYDKGLLGHSDADVLSHAIMDALLGAAALGDIGQLFPDTDERYAGADSLKLLSAVCAHLRSHGWEIVNTDATIVAQRPKLMPYIPEMRFRLAEAMGVPEGPVSVKATTEAGSYTPLTLPTKGIVQLTGVRQSFQKTLIDVIYTRLCWV